MSKKITNSEIRAVDANQDRHLTRRNLVLGGVAAGVSATVIAQKAQANTQKPPQPATSKANPKGRFADKVVVVTGATSGIGEATAIAFAQEGAKVAFNGRRANLGRKIEQLIRQQGGEATYIQTDVREPEQVTQFFREVIKRYGRLDIAFNNAGIVSPNAPSAEQSLETWINVMDTNVRGYWLCMKEEINIMLKQGSGHIINNASVSAHVGFANIMPYSVSKHAVLGLTKCAALEYGPQNIRINSISPGGVDTPMRRQAILAQNGDPTTPPPNLPKRINTSYEMARVVMMLASDDATSILGTDIDVTTGMLTSCV
jgi:NAD(P)-dependent dehydrogenase (short-subunit alcohol dehydrogenase family)